MLEGFCNGDDVQYNHLVPFARSLGAAFQKVNFLRDIRSDVEQCGRVYFPGVDFNHFTDADKYEIIQDVKTTLPTLIKASFSFQWVADWVFTLPIFII